MKARAVVPTYEVDPLAATMLPVEYCLDRGVVVLGPVGSDPATPINVGMRVPSDITLADEVSRELGRPIVPVAMAEAEFQRTIARLYRLPLGEPDGGMVALSSDPKGTPASPAEFLEALLTEGIRRRATDLHLEVYARGIDVRVRVDGVLRLLPFPIAPDLAVRMVSRIKVLCGLDLAEHRHDQDGRFSVLFTQDQASRRVDVRVSILPGPHGQDVAMRLLDPHRFILNLNHLDMPAPILDAYRRLTRVPHGLLLASGPTGAGKTTTLYATLHELQDGALKIVSVEDPIEYEFTRVNQKNVTAQMGFADHLRAFLRSNPDVIHVGEIRDPETAEIAVRAGTTGHRVLGTLHTRDAVSSVARLRALGVPDDFLSEVLLGVLGQRLLRRLCPECKRAATASSDLAGMFYRTLPEHPFFSPVGCPKCDGTGYRGLIGAFELFEPNDAVTQAIASGLPVEELRRVASENGWVPLVEDALHKATLGLTSLEEVARRLGPRFRGAAGT